MDIGLIIAVLAAASFGLAHVLVKKGVSQIDEAFTSVATSVFAGTIIFSIAMFFTGEWDKIWALSWQGWFLLGAGGILHFVVGRLLMFKSIRLIGANKAAAIGGTSLLYAVSFGIIFLGESLTLYLVIGATFIAMGTLLVSIIRQRSVSRIHVSGVLASLIGALFWGISGVLIKPAIEEIGSPLAASFISYLVASLALGVILFRTEQREQLTKLSRAPLTIFIISSVFFTLGQLLRYMAYGYSPVSVVTLLIHTYALFTFFFSFFINRKIEVFTPRVFIGLVATVAGAFLLFL
ncbi:EamA family transporter [Chloroflexota bacterium]